MSALSATEAPAREIRVQYYALLREQAGRSTETLQTRARTPRELYLELRAKYPFTLPAGNAARGRQCGIRRLVAAARARRCRGVHSSGGRRMNAPLPFGLFRFSEQPLDTAALQRELRDDSCGGFAAFEGWVRNHNEGHAVTRLEYEAFVELADKEGARIVAEAARRFGVTRAACVHRVGSLAIGDVAVWVGVSAAHRDEAFRACRFIIDEVKHRVPIWKKEHYVNGDSGWVNCERCAGTRTITTTIMTMTTRHADSPPCACA